MNYTPLKPDGRTYNNEPSLTAMTFNGVVLDNEVPGYRTLNVSGRETVGYTLSQAGDLPGRDGTVIYSKSIAPRVMTVTYELKASNTTDYHEAYALLSQLLHTDGDVEITFNDDPYSYEGQVTAKSEPDPGELVQVSNFTITCQNPFRLGPEEEITGTGSLQVDVEGGLHRTNPEISVLLASDTPRVIVRNITTGKRIIFEHAFKAGDRLSIRIYPRPMANLNGVNAMPYLAFATSDFGEFKVRNGDRVTVEPANATVTLKMKGASI